MHLSSYCAFTMETQLLKRCLTTAVNGFWLFYKTLNSFRSCLFSYLFSNQFTIYKSTFVLMILYFKPVLIYVQIYYLNFQIKNPEIIQLSTFTKKLTKCV